MRGVPRAGAALGFRVSPTAATGNPWHGCTHDGCIPCDGLRTRQASFGQNSRLWETSTTLVERWRDQQSQLATRVDEADLRYQSLLERFERSAADGDANLP